MKRAKKLLALLLCAAMVLSLAACGGNNANANANANANNNSEDNTAAVTNDIVVAASSLGSTLNPWDQVDGTTSAFQYATYEFLVKYETTTDSNGNKIADTSKLVGSLAKSWESNEDETEWTFHLDPDAKFANGDKVTAEDVVWSFTMCSENANSSFFFSLTNIETMEAVDEETVVFTLSQKSNMFLRLLEIYSFSIVNKDEAEAGIASDPDYLTTHTCGSGPYTIETYDTTSEVVLKARDDYWGENKAKNDSVTWKLVQEASDRQLLLENGDVDVALDLEDKNIAGVAAEDGITVEQFASNKHLFLCLNNNIAPFDDPKVRLAIAYAIPYDDLVNEVMSGNAVRTTSMMPDNVTGHIDEEGKTYVSQDLEKAKELLAEAGYPDGFSCTMTLGNGFTDWEESAVTIQYALKQIGIDMKIDEIDRAAFLTEAANGQIPIFLNRFNPFIGDPGYLVNCLYTTSSSYNYYNYSNAEFDALYEQAEAASTTEERLACYEEMQYIFGEENPVIQLYQYGWAYCGRDNVSGFVFYPDLTLRFANLSKG